MKPNCLWLFFFLLLFNQVQSQTFYNPSFNRRDVAYCDIVRIERNPNNTVVYFQYTAPTQYVDGGWVCAGKQFFIRDSYTPSLKFNLIKANNIPLCPEHYNFKYKGQKLEFSLEFEKLNFLTTKIDVIEDEGNVGFNFYGVSVSNSANTNTVTASQNYSANNFSSDCDNVTNLSASPKPELNTFLAGVRYATIITQPKINGHIPAFNGLIDLLKAMGFERIQYFDKNYIPPTNPCEEVLIDLGFDYDLSKFYNVKWTFASSCLGYQWDFTSRQYAPAGLYDDAKGNFYRLLRNMYQYKKPDFDSRWTLKNASQTTCWTETKLKDNIKTKGCDRIEGIYENSSSATSARYKVAVKKINGAYYFIYLSGADNNVWNEGDVKATLEPTATPNFYKAKWYMANKSINDGFYVLFDPATFSLVDPDSKKELYIKLFPAATDNISLPSDVKSSGSGFAISSNGYIVTNYHVTQDASKIRVRGINGDFNEGYSARVITDDKNNDLSIIKIDDPSFTSLGSIPYTIVGKTADVGTSVFVLGYPLRATMGDEIKLTNGIISSKSGFQGDITAYQMTAPIQPGNSGGPMFDSKGNIIGIVNAKHKGAENASYAIKSSYLLNLVDLLPNNVTLPTLSQILNKPLTEQVKIVKRYTYIIEIN